MKNDAFGADKVNKVEGCGIEIQSHKLPGDKDNISHRCLRSHHKPQCSFETLHDVVAGVVAPVEGDFYDQRILGCEVGAVDDEDCYGSVGVDEEF